MKILCKSQCFWIHLAVTVFIVLPHNADLFQIQSPEVQISAKPFYPLLHNGNERPEQTSSVETTYKPDQNGDKIENAHVNCTVTFQRSEQVNNFSKSSDNAQSKEDMEQGETHNVERSRSVLNRYTQKSKDILSLYKFRRPVINNLLISPVFYIRNFAEFYSNTNRKQPVSFDLKQNMRQYFLREQRQNMPPSILTVERYNIRQTLQTDPTYHMQKPIQEDPTRNTQSPVQIRTVYMRLPLRRDLNHDLRQHERVHSHLRIRSIPLHPTHSMVQPVLTDSTHTMQQAVKVNQVQLHPSHNMREPPKVDPTYSMRYPVQTDPSHNLRQPVHVDPSHKMRQPVQVDPSHNMRRPVALHESHYLRWPVMEEDSHDGRNTVKEIDLFKSEFLDTNDKNVSGKREKFNTNMNENKNYSAIYQMKQEDEILESLCNRIPNELEAFKEKKAAYDNLLSDAVKVCGTVDNTSRTEKSEAEWPWIVTIQQYMDDRYFHICGGSLLNSQWVVTAAHCVWLQPKFDFLLRLGCRDSQTIASGSPYTERLVSNIVIHPRFNSVNLENDVALLRIASPVEFTSNVAPICMPERATHFAGRNAQVLGRRLRSERGSFPRVRVQVLSTLIIPNRKCEKIQARAGYTEKIGGCFLCTGNSSELDFCEGDSGSPLIVLNSEKKWSLVGLFSWGNVCGSSNNLGIYTRISKFLQWINQTIDCYENKLLVL